MNELKRLYLIISAIFILILAFSHPAYAYLDPGTGSYIMQVLLAAIFAAGITVKIYWGKVKDLLVGIFSKAEGYRKGEGNSG